MTTESDAVLATIVDNWGGGGYGGALPKIQSTADISVDRWAALDAVIVLHDTLDERHPPVNDKFVDKEYTMDIRVTSITSEDQLKLLVEEVEYLLNNTAITGFTSARVTRKYRGSSDRKRKVYRNDISIVLWARVSSSAIAPAGGTLGTTTVGDLIVSGGDIFSPASLNFKVSGDESDYFVFGTSGNQPKMSAISADVQIDDNLEVTGTLEVTGVTTFGDESITSAQIVDLLMFGSANAAWVICPLEGWQPTAAGTMTNIGNFENIDGTDFYAIYTCTLPTNRGGLKLYVAGTRVSLLNANGTNLVDWTYVDGLATAGKTSIDADNTAKNSSGLKTDEWTAVDASSYYAVKIRLHGVVADAGALDIQYVLLKCYYAA